MLLEQRVKEHPSCSRWAGPWVTGPLTLRVAGHGLRAPESRGWLSQAAGSTYILSAGSVRWGKSWQAQTWPLELVSSFSEACGWSWGGFPAGTSSPQYSRGHQPWIFTSERLNGVPCSLPRVPSYLMAVCGWSSGSNWLEGYVFSMNEGEFQDFLHLCFSLRAAQK